MAETTGIQWTDATVNFWTGCKKVSDGCKFCYMYRGKERWGQDPTKVVAVNATTVFSTLRKLKESSKIFTCSWSDFFIKEADQWRDWAWRIIKENPQHQWQILTKRPERIKRCLPKDWGEGYPNVWLGVTVENNKPKSRKRIYELCHIPAKIRFISCEPLLGHVLLNLDAHMHYKGDMLPTLKEGHKIKNLIHWVIVGGESGNGLIPNDPNAKYKYRECHTEWIDFIVKQCKYDNVPVFVKQYGTHLAKELNLKDKTGGNIKEFVKQLQVREFPKY